MKSRVLYTSRNIIWGYVSSMITIILSFICRTVFIHTIGVEYLGINGLFTSVLGVLSLTELGVGTAMNYSLYKPVAENDTEKIKSLMLVYKKAYRYIATCVAVLGILIIPFMDHLIEGAENVENIIIYYLVFLFNTVSSYLVSYKYSVVNADQKNYLISNITTIFNVFMNAIQIISLVICKSYMVYLFLQALTQLVQKIFTSCYIDKKYPYLKSKNIQKLDKEEKDKLVKDVKALICHKIGEVSVNQTDNIIISIFVNVISVGIVSNYILITSTVNSLINIIFNGTIGSLGNLFATSDENRQYKVFKTIDFVGFWIFSFSSVAIFSLVQPFVVILWGKQYILPLEIVALFIINNYMVGQRISINNIKVAGGIFNQDKYLALIQSAVNLVVSVLLATRFGLIGVYIGTIVSGLIPSLIRPYIVYKHLLKKNVIEYYLKYCFRFGLTVTMSVGGYFVTNLILSEINILNFIFALLFIIIIPNIIMVLLFRKSEEYEYLRDIVINICKRIKRKNLDV